jgi:hypothetical protein
MYNRPIEIFAYSNEPMRTFHESEGKYEPFRLSYHGQSHYNLVVPFTWTKEDVFVSQEPGEVEKYALQMSKLRYQDDDKKDESFE